MPKQKTSPADYPQAVIQQIEQLAQNIVTARRRRKETQAQWAGRLGVSQPTMARIERGDPGVAVASYVMCMWLVNQAQGLADLIAPQNDHSSLEREVARTRTRRQSAAKVETKKVDGRSAASGRVQKPEPQFVQDPGDVYLPVTTVAPTNLAGINQNSEIERALRLARLDSTSAFEQAKRLAAFDPSAALEQAMRSAGLDPSAALEQAMRSAGLSMAGANPNASAAGLAALLTGRKKPPL